MSEHAPAGGSLHLVGAGPGDPLLLTRRAARLLGDADVVVLDRRSLEGIAGLAPHGAERCFVGRTLDGPGWETERIVDLLVDRVQAGRVVVRLKSGDPIVCSRGGEERAALLRRGMRCEVVPGVTAATAAPLAAGTAPGRSVTILAGNDDPCYPPLDLAALADPHSSLVVLTGRARQGSLATTLAAAGLDGATPVAVVHAATRPRERVVVGSLADLGSLRLPAPATVIIGPAQAGHPPSRGAVPTMSRGGRGRPEDQGPPDRRAARSPASTGPRPRPARAGGDLTEGDDAGSAHAPSEADRAHP